MNEIKKLLYKHLNRDSIKLLGMNAKVADVHWLVEKGYQEDFKISKNGMRMPGEITPKGKAFDKEYNKEVQELFKKTENNLTYENEERTRKDILKFVKEHKKLNFSLNSSVFKGFTDDERYAFLYFMRNPMDSGRR